MVLSVLQGDHQAPTEARGCLVRVVQLQVVCLSCRPSVALLRCRSDLRGPLPYPGQSIRGFTDRALPKGPLPSVCRPPHECSLDLRASSTLNLLSPSTSSRHAARLVPRRSMPLMGLSGAAGANLPKPIRPPTLRVPLRRLSNRCPLPEAVSKMTLLPSASRCNT